MILVIVLYVILPIIYIFIILTQRMVKEIVNDFMIEERCTPIIEIILTKQNKNFNFFVVAAIM